LLLFLEREEYFKLIDQFLGASPQNPVVPLRGMFEAPRKVWDPTIFCEAELMLFASFSGKRRVLLN
jgi:hypothetical protein